MSDLREIRAAIASLPERERALLAAEICATELPPDDPEIEAALSRGLRDVEAGRVCEIETLLPSLGKWTTGS